jgi:[ribosomal protein S18]-alanine N-acetyltransferase
VRIRPLEARDIESVLTVQSACPEIAQWVAWDYDRVARGEMPGWVADDEGGGGEVAGFIVARRIASDAEILNFAVRPGLRRQGLGAALLNAALFWAQELSAEKVILEVRVSNDAALRFYKRHNFQTVGRRAGYYASPVEDALLLSRSPGANAPRDR